MNESDLITNENNEFKHNKKAQKEEPSLLKTLIIDAAIAVAVALLITTFIARPTIVKQSSMEDTFHQNDYVFLSKLSYVGNKTPQRGDVIVFKSDLVNEENGGSKLLIKRVIGIPGDTIQIKNDQLILNGEIYEEDYIKDGITPPGNNPADGEIFTVPDDEYYCMGDNRVVSLDSRYSDVGTITEDEIVGKAVLRLYPFNKIQTF